ncbi:autotransporter-associated beta strand repeat-containing protein [Porphyrobacter sp. ULC335]|uniref:autotransporter-associated beta strand repeat-containing protein n=1 Tax=Porphyrobacter sp. ULC335 TaxID=2854260 RepID=UPI00221FA029|nr:autotransporter-associated beta strand repeat-containing protein [Porphyrobacter sp. ULC335]UYV16018.1 autotransporter-associated beta strand repeat-containing protein [Porphyrobacter sp. ULC335]
MTTVAATRRSAKLLATTALVPALMVMAAAPAAAQSWDGGAGTQNWSDAANWNPDGVPIDNRSVSLDQTDRVELTTDSANLNFLTIQDRASLVARAQLTAIRTTLLDSAQLIIALNGRLNGDVEVRGRDAVLSNNTTINGNVLFAPVASGNARFFNYGVVTGTTTINGGTVEISFNSNFSDTAAFTVNGGLVNVVRSDTIGSLSGRGGTISFGNGTRLTVNQSVDGSFSGALTGSGSFNTTYFAKSGTATLTLAGANTTTGGRRLDVLEGTLQLQGGNAVGDQNILNIGEGTVRLLNSETIGALVGGDLGTLEMNGQTLLVGGVGAPFTANSSVKLRGAGVFRLAAPELTLQLDGDHEFTGTYRVSNGALRLGGTGDPAAYLEVDGGTLELLADREAASVILAGGSITGPGTLTTYSDIDARSGNISAALAGSVGLQKTTSGTVTLSGANTYTGETRISAGTLQIGDGGTTGTLGTGNIVNNAALVFNRSDDVTVGGIISGSGSLTKKGAGTLSLSGANTYGGRTTIEQGALRVAGASALGSPAGSIVVLDGGMLAFDVGVGSVPATFGNAITLNGTGVGGRGALWSLSGATTLTGDITLGSAATISTDEFVSVTGGINNAGHLLTKMGAGLLQTSGTLSGSGGLTLNEGTIILEGANTYTGTTTINSGNLVASGGSAISDLGAVEMTGGLFGLNNDETIGALAGTGGRVQNNGSGTITLTVGGNGQSTTFGGQLVQNLDFRGAIALTKVGTGTLTLTGANTTRGTLRVEGGMLALGTNGTLSGSSAVEIAGGTLSLGSFTNTAASVTLTSGSITGAGTLNVNGNYTQSGGTLEAGATVNVGVTGRILLSGGTVAGTLRGNRTFSGPHLVSGGSVLITGFLDLGESLNIGGLAEGTSLRVESGGRVNTITAIIAPDALTTGSVTITGQGSRWNSTLLFAGGLGSASLTIADGGVVTTSLQGSVDSRSGPGSVGTVTGGGSRWEMSGLGVGISGKGTLTIADGGVVATGFGSVGANSGASGAVVVRGVGSRLEAPRFLIVGDRGEGALKLAEGGVAATPTLTIGRFESGTGTLIFGAAEGSPAAGAGTLEASSIIFGAGTGTIVFNHTASNFELAANISGNGTLRQIAGSTTLSGDSSSFTGTTTLLGGRLEVNGTLGGGINVNGGTLGGTGRLTGPVTINEGGILAAGQSPGTMTVAALTLNAGSTTIFELGEAGVAGGVNNDLVRVTGPLTLNGGSIDIVRGAGFSTGQYTLFEYGSLAGALGSMTLNPLGGGYFGNLALGTDTVLLNVAGAGDLVHWNGSTTVPTGAIVGGSGTWSLAGVNFTNAAGTVSGPWAGNGNLAVFGGASGGTVTIAAGETVAPVGLDFVTDGYTIVGGDAASRLELAGPTGISTASGVGATISAIISGGGSLTKTGAGTLTLSGDNTYTGLTSVLGGTLINSGTILGGVNNAARVTSTGTITGTLVNQLTGTVLLEGAMNGNIDNTGLITLTGITTGITNLNQGILDGTFDMAGFNTAIGSLSGGGSVRLGSGTLTIGTGSGSTGFFGEISGSGGVTKVGDGTQVFSGAQTYTGLTQIDGGFQVVFDGSLAGSVLNNAGFSLGGLTGSRLFGDLTNTGTGFAEIFGQVDGAVQNDGRLTSLGRTTYLSRITQGAGGSFELNGFDSTIGSLAGGGTVLLGSAMLTTGTDNTDSTFGGVISGSGALTKVGTGVSTLSGLNTYTGLTTISAGTLSVASTGGIVGAVQNNATFNNDGSVGGILMNNAGASATNSGTITGRVINNGTFTSTGTLNGGLLNSGTSQLGGAVNGDIDNSGTITLTGISTGINTVAQTGTGVFNLAGFNTTIGTLSGLGAVNLGSATLTTGGSNTLTNFGGVISGGGGLTKVGTGLINLTGVNTYTGLTTVSAGSIGLDVGAMIAGPVLNNATFINAGTVGGLVTNNGSLTSAGTINGGLINNAGATAELAGTVNGGVSNSGAITLFGNLAASGAFNQTATGSFNLAGFAASLGSLAGSGTVSLGSGQLTVGGLNTSTNFSGVISGSGPLIKLGTGTFTLTGVNTYTGTTFVDAGTLVLAAGGELEGSVRNAATFNNAGTVRGVLANVATGTATNSGTIGGGVNNAGTFTSTGTINTGLENSGIAQISGALNGFVTNSGTITLTGSTTGITIFDQSAAGTFNLAGFNTTLGALTGAGSVNLGSARLTTGGLNLNTLLSGVIGGTGSLEKVGTGRFTLTGANSYSGGTTITGGALQLGDGGTTGSIVGPIVNNSMLIVNRSDANTLAGNISGTGMFAQVGTGITTLTGTNTYAGGTLITAGRLVGNAMSLQGPIQTDAPGVLEFAQATAGTYAGSLLGTGRFDKTGAGLLTLTGNSSTYTGGTFVIGGELRVNGDYRSSVVTVQTGTTLSGTGIIGGLVAQSGSTIAPGTSPGTLTVNGNVSLAAGSTVQYGIAATAPWDRILATGTASLNGTAAFTNLSGANAYAFGSTYLLLQADGGRTGTFANTTGFAGFGNIYRPELVYTGTQVSLRFAPNLLANIVGNTALTANQRSVVNRIDGAVAAGYNPQPLFNIYALPTAQLPGAFDQLSGEVYATAAGVGIEQERLLREAVLGRAASAAMAARTTPGAGSGVGAWGQLFGGWGDGDSDGNAAAFDTDRMGFVTGLDYGKANENGSWRAGVFGMQIQSDVTIDARGSASEVEQSGAGAYASLTTGGFGVTLGGYLTEVDLRAFRNINLPGFAETNVGVTEGKGRQAFAELSYTIEAGKALIRPFVAGSIGTFKLDGLRETGGAAALDVARQSYSTGTVTGGIDGSVKVGKVLRLGGSLGARAQLGDRDPQALIALAAAPQQAFAIDAAQLDEVAFAGRFDAVLELEENLMISVGYTGLIGSTQTDHGARATVQVRF